MEFCIGEETTQMHVGDNYKIPEYGRQRIQNQKLIIKLIWWIGGYSSAIETIVYNLLSISASTRLVCGGIIY
jgi:hypothetical protein